MGWKTAVGAGLLGGLAGFIGGYIVKGNQSKIPNTKELKENLRKECNKFLKSIKKDLKQSKEATIWYKKVEKWVENILSIVNSLPDIESKSAASTSKLNKLKLEADRLDKVTRILFEEAEKNKYISNPGILTWLTYSTGDLINAYDKLTEVKSFSNIVVEDSWYTRMQSNTTTSEYSDPVTKKQSIFSKAKKGKIGKAYDRSEDLDENYKAELDDRGIRDTHSKYDKNKSSYNIAPQYVKGTVKGTLKGLRNGALVGGALGTAGGAFLGPVGALAGGAVGTAVGAPIGLAVGALRGGVKAVKRKTKNIENERKGYLKDFDREKDLINRLKDGRK